MNSYGLDQGRVRNVKYLTQAYSQQLIQRTIIDTVSLWNGNPYLMFGFSRPKPARNLFVTGYALFPPLIGN
jgi:hypothetical protein